MTNDIVFILFALGFAAVAVILYGVRNPGTIDLLGWLRVKPLLPLVLLALVGFVFSVVIHVLSIFGVSLLSGEVVFLPHLAIFIIWVPVVLIGKSRGAKDLLGPAPRWMKYAVGLLFAYVMGSYLYFAFTAPKRGSPEAKQQDPPSPRVVRGFSGHWMLFYGAGCVVLWSEWKQRREATSRRCPNGHPVSKLATQCSECGTVVPDKQLRVDPKNFA